MDRTQAFGQDGKLTLVDRFGIWLSLRQLRKWAVPRPGLRVCEVGAGYHAPLSRAYAAQGAQVTALDLALSPEVQATPGLQAVEGSLPGTLQGLGEGSMDLVLCISVLEHLWEPLEALASFHRMLAPGGLCLINVPSWRGKAWLEHSAFRMGWSPKAEMDDHKTYYDPRDLWPLLVRAGFQPSGIRCFRHKFSLNTFAVCRKAPPL